MNFATGDRCFSANCDPISTYYANWKDVPYHQDFCASGASCQVTAPTFWSTVALATVSTGLNCSAPGTCATTADSWSLAPSLPAQTDGTANLWLASVTRTGTDATTPGTSGGNVALPKVTFSPHELANRVNPGTYPYLYRNRIGKITTETGLVITVTYTTPSACNPASMPSPASNTKSCFPEYWGTFTSPNPDWFNKWAAGSVQVSDPAGGSPGLYTSYAYASPAWHYDDNEVVQPKYRTYGQWRGYQDVRTYSGTGDPQTETETTYYQGMSDDNNTTTVNVTDSQQNAHEDLNQLAGNVLETTAYTYASATSTPPVDHSDISSYWVSAAAMTRTRSGLPDLTANATGRVEDWTRQAITDSGTTWRKTETDTSYYTGTTSAYLGLPKYAYAHGDLTDSSQQRCTTISYATANTTENLAGLPSETEVDAAACGGSNPGGASAPGSGQVNALTAPVGLDYAHDVISDTRIFYDAKALAQTWPQPASPAWPQAAPTLGDVSVVRKATGYNTATSQFTYQTASAEVYDARGRVTSSYDGNGGFNGTAYVPTTTAYTMTNGSTTKITVTNPLGQAVATSYDPARALPVTVTDANQIATNLRYDDLGRLTGVWQYSRPVTATANYAYAYAVSNSGPTVVTTSKLNDAGATITSTTLYDSLLRLRQAQYPTPQGGSLITDHFYDSRGWQYKTNSNWWAATSNPGTAILTVPDSQVPDQTVTSFDGLGRAVQAQSYDGPLTSHQLQSTTYHAYYGDRVTSVLLNDQPATPVVDGTPQSTVTDALGRTAELDQYSTPPSVTAGTNAGGFATVTISGGTTQATAYSYGARGWLSAISASGETWSRGYNQLGQVTSATDPNAGATSMTYDADGNLTATTDANLKTITYAYDPLGRRTGEYDGPSTTSPPIAAWVYDNSDGAVTGMTNPIGHLTSETSYDGAGNAYKTQQNGFNAFGEATSETVTIPPTTATGALGTSYTLTHLYTTTTGLPLRDIYPASPAGGALPSESVTRGYCTGFDLPCGLSSNLTGVAYTQNATYTAFFQVAQVEIGSATSNAYITSSYDPHTGNLTDTKVTNTAVSATPYDDTSYAYDPAGNITSQTDTRSASGTTAAETQCYGYDTLSRLSAAWTATDSCAAPPSTGTGGNVGDQITGGAYWTSWTYSPLGDQQAQTQHSVTGGTNTITTYTYNGNGAGQPDTLTSAATTGPGAGTSTWTYDAAGNTKTRNLPAGNQALTWYNTGKLRTDTTAAGTTTYIYDADGNLLLQEDPAQTTLYIFGEQLVLAGGAVTGTRFLPLPGGGTAVRTGGTTNYSFETTDQHDTSTLTLDHACQNPVWRQFTPYGAPRGTPTGQWPDTNGYLGDPTGTNTGLTTIGARQYDPSTGRFISIDPILETNSPQQLNGYTYATDNPATNADPTGLCVKGDPGSPPVDCNGNPVGSGGGQPSTGTQTNTSNLPTCDGPIMSRLVGCTNSMPQAAVSAPSKILGINSSAGAGCVTPVNWIHLGTAPCGFTATKDKPLGSFTVGNCVSGALGLFGSGGVSFCWVVSHNGKTGQFQFGTTESFGGGPGSPVAGVGSGPTISNAPSVSALGGPFADAGGSGEIAGGSAGGDYFLGRDAQNESIKGVTLGVGPKIDAPFVVFGAEGHVWVTNTWTQTWFNW